MFVNGLVDENFLLNLLKALAGFFGSEFKFKTSKNSELKSSNEIMTPQGSIF